MRTAPERELDLVLPPLGEIPIGRSRRRRRREPWLIEALLDAAASPLAVTDAELVLRAANAAFCRVLQTTRADVVGRPLDELVSYGRSGDLGRDAGRDLEAQGTAVRTVSVQRTDGPPSVWELSLSAVADPQQPAGARLVRLRASHSASQEAPLLGGSQRSPRGTGSLAAGAGTGSHARAGEPFPMDTATGLPRWGLLRANLDHRLAAARRTGELVAAILVDLPDARDVNQTLGHTKGRELLAQAARRLRGAVRRTDTVSRLSGDTFGLVCPGLTERADIDAIASVLVKTLGEPFAVAGTQVFVGPRVGIAVFPDDSEDAETLLRNAEVALGQARAAAQEGFRFYASEMHENACRRTGIEAALHRVLETDQLALEYQPLVDLASGQLASAEVLLRWTSPQFGVVPPDELVAAAERVGLLPEIGEWVLRTACLQQRAWLLRGCAPRRIGVNVASQQLARGDFEVVVSRALRDAGLEAARLELEITETAVLDHDPSIVGSLERLREMGVRIAIDDFGTGWSSLKYLTSFPVDTIKIDRAFVSRLPDAADAMAIVGAIMALARALGLETVAEGIETADQLAVVRQLGCDRGQGFLFSKPLPPERFCETYRRT